MRNFIIAVLVLGAVGYVVSDFSQMWRARSEFQARLDLHCGAVNESNSEAMKQTLVQEAGQYRLRLAPADIRIGYVDAPEQSLAQNIVGNRLGTQFVNKRATIECRVVAPVLGLGVTHQLRSSRLIQVKAVQPRGRSELETMMDAAPPF